MNLRNLAIWGGLLLVLVAVYAAIGTNGGATMPGAKGAAASRPAPITYSQLITAINGQEIKTATVRGDTVSGVYKNDSKFTTVTPLPNADIIDKMQATGAAVEIKSTRQPWWSGLLGLLLPVALIIAFWFFIMNRMQGGAKGAMGFGKSKAKLLTEHKGR